MRRRLPVGRELLSTIHALLGSQPPGEHPGEAEPKMWSQRQAASSATTPGAVNGWVKKLFEDNGVDGRAGASTRTHVVPALVAHTPQQSTFKTHLVRPVNIQCREAEERAAVSPGRDKPPGSSGLCPSLSATGGRRTAKATLSNVKASSSASTSRSTGPKAAAAARVSVML